MNGARDPFHDGHWQAWGRVDPAYHRIAVPAFSDTLGRIFREASTDRQMLPVGLGRSYGETNIAPGGEIIRTRYLDRLIAFDETTNVLTAEAGISLAQIIKFALPRGLFLPTSPGTRFVTLGGAIANDVHGKNHHHAGSIGHWIHGIYLLRSDRDRIRISPGDELFSATIGGLGLTGVIVSADIQLIPVPSATLDQEIIPFGNLHDFFTLADESEATHEHTVAWIDCLGKGSRFGRGVFSRANWSRRGPLTVRPFNQSKTLPIDAPGFALNGFTIGAFNEAYFQLHRLKERTETVPYDTFFYPLDTIGQWNRLYGKKGFYQYQSVVPPEHALDATEAMLTAVADAGEGSFLAVLKTFGDHNQAGLLSFPMKGATLALDFRNRGERTHRLLAKLDDIVREANGRLYPAKDGRMPPEMFAFGYPEHSKFRQHVDPAITSKFWARMKDTL